MYDFIKGNLVSISLVKVTVDTGSIGYLLNIPLSTYHKLPQINNKITLYTSLIVKEDSHTLYGFITKEERDLFEMVITVSGIGPKTGLALIGNLDIANFHDAISTSNIKLLSKIPGIGKKTAERLIIEIRDKIKVEIKEISSSPGIIAACGDSSHISDTLKALLNLGYNHLQAQKAINKAIEENTEERDPGKLIALALKKI